MSGRSTTAMPTASAISRADRKARLPGRSRRHGPLAAAVFSLSVEGRRLRHLRLPRDPSDLWHSAATSRRFSGGASARPARHHRVGDQPHVRSARVVSTRARAPPGSSNARDFYVWSDTRQQYADARIIFKDFETSNWTWDPVAQAYYWHRFFSHQPDLNFDNPAGLRRWFR